MKQEKIGKFIKEKRLKKNLTQSEFANILGVTERTVSNWENGKNLPDLSLYNDICKILNITTNELINGMDLKNNLDIKKLIPSLISLTIIILVFIINSKSIFSFILILISLIIILFNLNKITNKKVTIISFVSLVIFLNFIDYLNVQINNELPVLKYSIKNNINTIKLIVFGFLKTLEFSILFIFSLISVAFLIFFI